MRLGKFLKEESALDIKEPEVGDKYSERIIKKNIEKIEKAISKAGAPSNDAEEAILADLEDKLDKWNNVEKETKPAGPFKSAEGGQEKEPPEEEEPEPPPEEKEEPEEEPDEDEEEKKKEKK